MHQNDFGLIRVVKGNNKGLILPCFTDQRLYIGCDEDQCDLVIQGEEINPVHACAFFDPVNRLFGVKDLSDRGMMLENGYPFPKDKTIHIPEGTILYLGSLNQAIMMGRKDATSYLTNLLPPGTLIRQKYLLENKPLQIFNGMMYNGISLKYEGAFIDGNSGEWQGEYHEESRTIYCVKRLRHILYHAIPRIDGVVPIDEIINEYDTIFFITKEWPGRNLESLLTERQHISTDEICRILKPVMETLASLHSIGCHYGYLSPGQIFIPEDNPDQVRLLTAGCLPAMVILPPDIKKDYVDPAYAAPEFINSSLVTNPDACEIYSICTILYRAITGNLPDKPEPEDQLLLEAVRTAIPDPEDDNLAKAWSGLILDGLLANPAQRISSLKELKSRLAHCTEGNNHLDQLSD